MCLYLDGPPEDRSQIHVLVRFVILSGIWSSKVKVLRVSDLIYIVNANDIEGLADVDRFETQSV